MPVNLSIKNVPDDIVDRLRARAQRHHRSLQGELLAIVEDAVRPDRFLTAVEGLNEVRRLGFSSPSESFAMSRADRVERRYLKPSEIYELARELGLSSGESSADLVRQDRERDDHR